LALLEFQIRQAFVVCRIQHAALCGKWTEVDHRVTNPKVEGHPETVPRLWGLRTQGVDIEQGTACAAAYTRAAYQRPAFAEVRRLAN